MSDLRKTLERLFFSIAHGEHDGWHGDDNEDEYHQWYHDLDDPPMDEYDYQDFDPCNPETWPPGTQGKVQENLCTFGCTEHPCLASAECIRNSPDDVTFKKSDAKTCEMMFINFYSKCKESGDASYDDVQLHNCPQDWVKPPNYGSANYGTDP